MTKGKWKKWLGLALVVVLVGGVFLWKRRTNSGTWVALHQGTISDAVYGLATLEAKQVFRYKSGITTQVRKVWVKEGDTVLKDASLIQLGEGAMVRAPFAGVVTQLDAKDNETVFQNFLLVTLMNLKDVELSITLEQSSALRVSTGQKVRIQFESVQESAINGMVRAVYPKDSQFIVKVTLPEAPKTILPGMTADTAIIVGEKEKAFLVPVRAVQRNAVFSQANGLKKKLKVKTGFQDSEWIELLEVEGSAPSADLKVWVPRS